MAPIPTATTTETVSPATLKLRGDAVQPAFEAYPEIEKLGYTVVKNVVSEEKAAEYVDRMYKWLESHGKGFKGADRSTWHMENLPKFDKGGLYHRYGVGHEQFAWDIRTEPGVIDAFSKIWGTDELLVSYDSVNMSLPLGDELPASGSKPWPHVDQSPTRRFKHCIQGIVNLLPNGPNDGGLMVLVGSTALFNQYFDEHEHLKPEDGWTLFDSYHHKEDTLQWFYDRGCKWHKVEAGPGDLILWDSRTVHYGAAAMGTEPRFATYVCYKPAKDISKEKLAIKLDCFENSYLTSHDPLDFRITNAKVRGWQVDDDERMAPVTPPVLTERAKKLAGLVPY